MAFSFPWFINGNRVSMATRRSCIVCAASICTFIITCIICIFGSPTISANDSMRMITSWICSSIMPMCRKFSDSILRRSLPQVNTNIRLHVVMGFVITSIAYSNSMNMGTCCIGRIGICAITITTTGNTSVRFVRTTKGKCVWMISCRVCACSMCMSRKFSDSTLKCSTPHITA